MSKTIFEHSTAGRRGVTSPKREIDIPVATMFPETMLRTKEARLPEVR